MLPYKADRVVRVLSFLVSAWYFVTWGAVVLILVGMPLARLVTGGRGDDWLVYTTVPVTVESKAPAMVSRWLDAGQHVELTTVHGELRYPATAGPGWFVALTWASMLITSALALLFLHHLRRLFQRVRGGSPFDAENARRLRWLGLLLLLLHASMRAFGYVTAVAVTKTLQAPGVALGGSFVLDGPIVLIALVLIALAEIFRRGAALEEEQSLVV